MSIHAKQLARVSKTFCIPNPAVVNVDLFHLFNYTNYNLGSQLLLWLTFAGYRVVMALKHDKVDTVLDGYQTIVSLVDEETAS